MIDHRYPGFAVIRLKNSSNFGAGRKRKERARALLDILIILFFEMKIMDIRLWY